jgi:hypothetical protein
MTEAYRIAAFDIIKQRAEVRSHQPTLARAVG